MVYLSKVHLALMHFVFVVIRSRKSTFNVIRVLLPNSEVSCIAIAITSPLVNAHAARPEGSKAPQRAVTLYAELQEPFCRPLSRMKRGSIFLGTHKNS